MEKIKNLFSIESHQNLDFSRLRPNNRVLRTLLYLAAIATLVIAVTPKWRNPMRLALQPDSRTILSSVSGDVFGDGVIAKILKVKTAEGLFLEIYEMNESQSPRLLQTIQLADRKDGYFMYNGEAANLILDDVDGDQVADIVAPSFDHNLIARLNVFSFSKTRRSFIRMN